MEIDSKEQHLTSLTDKIAMLMAQSRTLEKDSYPSDCVRVCGLKDKVQKIEVSLNEELVHLR